MYKFGMALDILGDDFISHIDIQKYQEIIYTTEQIDYLKDTIPSTEILEWCRENNFMLCVGPNKPLSLFEVQLVEGNTCSQKYEVWYANEPFTKKDKVGIGWIMFSKNAVRDSTSKSWTEQQSLLADYEVTPSLVEVVWCVSSYIAVRKKYILQNMFVRTSSLASDGGHVYVGNFNEKGFDIGNWCGDEGRPDGMGLSVIRKF